MKQSGIYQCAVRSENSLIMDTSFIFNEKSRSVCYCSLGSLVSVVLTWKNRNTNTSYYVTIIVLSIS